MNAGGGIIHRETPEGVEAGSMHRLQLWASPEQRARLLEIAEKRP
jgi:redox-sensitive bicupin YhaK (pirin superfamily)